MSDLATILAMGAGVYALRLSGMALPGFRLPGALQRALEFVPVALLAGLVATSLSGGTGASWYLAAVAGGVVAWLTGKMWACVVAGLLCYWLLTGSGLG